MSYTIKNPAIDIHNHFWVTTDKGRFSLDRCERSLETVILSMEKGGINISALTNSQDYRYEQIVENAKKCRGVNLKRDIAFYDNCIVIDGNKLLLRGEEVKLQLPKEQEGDIVVVGANRTLWQPEKKISLLDFIKIMKSEGIFALIPHLYSGHGGVSDVVNDIYQEFDAVEDNPNLTYIVPGIPFLDRRYQNKLARKFAEKVKKPFVKTSDGHHPDETGRGFFTTQASEFTFRDGEEAVSKLKSVVKSKIQNHGRPATTYELARLVIITIYDLNIRKPLRLVYTTFEGRF